MAASGGRGGFTMIELVVVITIIAIVFFAVQPSVTGLIRSAQERAGLRSLVGLLNYARTAAVARGRLVRVICDAAGGVWWAEMQVDPAVDRAEFDSLTVLGREGVLVPDSLSMAGLSIAGQAVATGAGVIYFYPDGRTDGATVTLAGDRGRQIVIALSPVTGRVTVSV